MSNENQTDSEDNGIIFMKQLFHLIHTARIHKDNNQLIRERLAGFKDILEKMTGVEDLKIQVWRGRFHINSEKLPFTRGTVNINNEMMRYFANRGLGGLHFLITSKKASHTDILTFIRLLDVSIKHETPRDWLEKKLGIHMVSWVRTQKKQDDDLQGSEKGGGRMKRQERARNAYLHALDTVKEVAEKASKGVAGVRNARRLAQIIVDLIQEDPSLMLGLATIKDYDDYTYTHSVNVSLLATSLGRYIGLSKVSLEYVSVCGLFHDLGKVEVSREVLLKKGELNPEEWKNMQGHPLLGVRNILRLNANKALRARIILGPFEHHLNLDMTGYPKTHFMRKVSLLGKILRIVDVYEALTAERAYRPRAFTPDEALRKMWSEAGKSFDPILLKSFIGMMGIYPIGSFVELSDGRIALVLDYPAGSQKTMPQVQILANDGKGDLVPAAKVSLSDQAYKEGLTRLEIVRGIIPSSLGVQAADLLLK